MKPKATGFGTSSGFSRAVAVIGTLAGLIFMLCVTRVPPPKQIQNERITAHRVIEVKGALTIEDLEIADGATLIVHALRGVSIGNGFEVHNGATVSLGIPSPGVWGWLWR